MCQHDPQPVPSCDNNLIHTGPGDCDDGVLVFPLGWKEYGWRVGMVGWGRKGNKCGSDRMESPALFVPNKDCDDSSCWFRSKVRETGPWGERWGWFCALVACLVMPPRSAAVSLLGGEVSFLGRLSVNYEILCSERSFRRAMTRN